MTIAAQALKVELHKLLEPIKYGSVKEWAEDNIILPAHVTQNDGPYSTWNCSYVDDCLEDFRDVTLTHSSWCMGAQVFKSTTVMVGLAYRVDQHPANAMWIMPNEALLKSFAETKWLPIVQNSPALRSHMPKNLDKFKKLEQQFDRMILYFVASGSEKNLKGRSVEVLILDEIDDIEAEWNKKGMSAVSMAESRTKSFVGSKIFKTGTPTVKTGAIWIAFLDGDQRLRFVDCPFCKKETTLEFNPEYTREYFPGIPAAKVVWDENAKFESGEWDKKKVADSARLECPHCKGLMTEGDKIDAVRKGRWKATNPYATEGKISRRLPSIYSPHPKTSIAGLAVKFLECLDTPGGLRNFINEELALPFQPKGTTITKSDIKEVASHSPHYLLGQIPQENIAMLSLTVDVQQTEFWWLIRAWYSDASSSLVEYGQAFSYDQLMELANRQYPIAKTGRTAQSLFCLIDSGYRAKRTGGVYEFCLGKGAGRFFPCQGRTEAHGFLKTVTETDVEYNGTALKLIQFSDPLFKYELYISRIKERIRNNWWLPQNFGKDYERGLSDEYLKEQKNTRGQIEHVWDTREGFNHLGDLEKMQLITPALLTSQGLKALFDKNKE